MSLELILPWIVVGICLLTQAFFAGSELAIINANLIKLEEMARGGTRSADRVLWFRKHPERLFATTLLGTNLSTVTGSTVASLTMLKLSPEHGEWYALLLMGPLVFLGAEVLPKTLAQSAPTTLAPRLVKPLYLFHRICLPFIALVHGYAGALYRLLGLEGVERAMISRDELVLLMEQEEANTDLEEGEREMIARIFTFSGTTARETMIPLVEVAGVTDDATVREAAAVVATDGYSRLVVHRDRVDDIVGVLHHIDLLSAKEGDQAVSALMTPPHFVPESQEIDDILVILQRSAANVAIVVDEFGGAVGLLTLEDILEEIVGEIHDEYDHGPAVWRAVGEGTWLVQARAPVERLNEELDLDLPESPDYETIAGLMLDQLKRIPQAGETVKTPGGLLLKVTRASDRAIEEVRLTRPRTRRPTGEHRRV